MEYSNMEWERAKQSLSTVCFVVPQFESSIYSNRTVSTFCVVKDWHLLAVYSYTHNQLMISQAIAVHDVYMQLRYIFMCVMSLLSSQLAIQLNLEQNIETSSKILSIIGQNDKNNCQKEKQVRKIVKQAYLYLYNTWIGAVKVSNSEKVSNQDADSDVLECQESYVKNVQLQLKIFSSFTHK